MRRRREIDAHEANARTASMNKLFLILSLTVLLAAGCARKETVHLIDGRSFEVDAVSREKDFVSFLSDGWEFTLPSVMVTNQKATSPRAITRITIATNSIYTQHYTFRGMDDMFMYVDVASHRTNPVVLVLPDAASWPAGMRDDFARQHGKIGKRLYVGMEGYWKKP